MVNNVSGYKESIRKFVEASKPIGDFAVGSKVPNAVFPIDLEGVGVINFPLRSEQATQLIASETETVPAGTNTRENMVDPTTANDRHIWEIPNEKINLNDEFKTEIMADILYDACKGLGLQHESGYIEAHLTKMLLFEQGGYSKRHQDMEKEEGMFGTLLIHFPAQHTGGDVVVKHKGKMERFTPFDDLNGDNNLHYCAFYADCEHELEPVTCGYSLILEFNLIRTTPKEFNMNLPSLAHMLPDTPMIMTALQEWSEDVNQNRPTQLAIKLDHQYTETNLSFSTLKDRDNSIFQRLYGLKGPLGDTLLDISLVMLQEEKDTSTVTAVTSNSSIPSTTITTKKWIHCGSANNHETDHMTTVVDIKTELLVYPGQDPMSVLFEKQHVFENHTTMVMNTTATSTSTTTGESASEITTNNMSPTTKNASTDTAAGTSGYQSALLVFRPCSLDTSNDAASANTIRKNIQIKAMLNRCVIHDKTTLEAVVTAIEKYGWLVMKDAAMTSCRRNMNEYVFQLMQYLYDKNIDNSSREVSVKFIKDLTTIQYNCFSIDALFTLLQFHITSEMCVDIFKKLPLDKLSTLVWKILTNNNNNNQLSESMLPLYEYMLTTAMTSDSTELDECYITILCILETLHATSDISTFLVKLTQTQTLSAMGRNKLFSTIEVVDSLKAGYTTFIPLIVPHIKTSLEIFESATTSSKSTAAYAHTISLDSETVLEVLQNCHSLIDMIIDKEVAQSLFHESLCLIAKHTVNLSAYHNFIPRLLSSPIFIYHLKSGQKDVVDLLMGHIKLSAATNLRVIVNKLFYKLFFIENQELRISSITSVGQEIMRPNYTTCNLSDLHPYISTNENLKTAIMNGTLVTHVCELRLAQLLPPEAVSESPWCMKYAVPNQPLLQAFLLSNKQSITLPNYFKNIVAARKFITTTLGVAMKYKLVSLISKTGGEGKRSYVTLTKTKDAYNRRIKIFNEITAERECLIQFINAAGVHVISTDHTSLSDNTATDTTSVSSHINTTTNNDNTTAAINNGSIEMAFSPTANASASKRSSMISTATTMESDTSTFMSPNTVTDSRVVGTPVGVEVAVDSMKIKATNKGSCNSEDDDDNNKENVSMKKRKLN